MGNARKIAGIREALAQSNAHVALLQRQVSELQVHAWTLQMVCAAMLEKLTESGSVVLTIEERRTALENKWGIETTILPDPAQPMIVRIMRGNQPLPEEGKQP